MATIEGLRYLPNYLTPAEQTALLSVVDNGVWLTDLKRRVQHYGYRYDYGGRKVDTHYLGALPTWGSDLAQRLYADGLCDALPDQVIVNEYLPGQGISAHVDCVPCFGSTIISISLGSACVMDFGKLRSTQKVPILLEAGSVVVMQSTARYDWQHAIAARKSDVWQGQVIKRARRVSITLRKVNT